MTRSQHGYTLIEMIIALALTGLIMAVLGGALFGLGKGFASTTTQAIQKDRVFRVSQALRASLSRLTSPPLGSKWVAIQGTREQLTWLAPMPESAPTPGLFMWSLSGAQGRMLLKLAQPNGVNTLPEKVLVDDLLEFVLSYQHPDSGHWSETWAEAGIPLRIRLSIRSVKGGDWPPMTIFLGAAG